MNKKLKIISLALSLSILSACNVIPRDQQPAETAEEGEQQVEVTEPLEQSGRTTYYRPLITEENQYLKNEIEMKDVNNCLQKEFINFKAPKNSKHEILDSKN